MRLIPAIIFIFCACRSGTSINDLKTPFPDSFVGKVQLLEVNCCPPGCGVFAWAIAQKFIVVEADINALKGKQIIVVERCPEFKGSGFFKEGKIYNLIASNQYDSSYLIFNDYDKKNPLLYWSEKTTLSE